MGAKNEKTYFGKIYKIKLGDDFLGMHIRSNEPC
jgi:hypothetical protein